MSAATVEYLFLTTAALYKSDSDVTAALPSVRLGSLLPAFALTTLGYDARTVSLYTDTSVAEAGLPKAKRIVFGEMSDASDGWSKSISAYRRLLSLIERPRERVVLAIADDHFDDPAFRAFYAQALPECLAVATVSETLAAKLRGLTSRPVHVTPEPVEGARGAARAPAARRRARPLMWLAERAGVPQEAWRIRLLWYGFPMNLSALLDLLPGLDTLARDYLLELVCVTQPVRELEQLLTPDRTRADAPLRAQFVQWSAGAVPALLAASDLVLIPSVYGDPRRQAKSPNRLVAALHGGRLPICHPLPAYLPYSQCAWIGENLIEGIRWALAHPRQVLERIAGGQRLIDERHSAEAVARAWLAVFRTKDDA
jgi:hypothetical protein